MLHQVSAAHIMASLAKNNLVLPDQLLNAGAVIGRVASMGGSLVKALAVLRYQGTGAVGST